MPLKGSQLAYYLKKRNPELYQKAKEIKERYNVTWDEAFAILRGEKKPPTQTSAIGSEIQSAISEVVERVESLEKRVVELGNLYTIINMLVIGLNRRFNFEKYRCIYMDSEGFCRGFYWTTPLKGYKMREVVEGVEKRYYINVGEHRWVCALCSAYTSKYLAEALDNLRSRQDFLELWLKSLEAQVKQAIAKQSDKEIREALERLKRLGL
jgi:hypothetical protein